MGRVRCSRIRQHGSSLGAILHIIHEIQVGRGICPICMTKRRMQNFSGKLSILYIQTFLPFIWRSPSSFTSDNPRCIIRHSLHNLLLIVLPVHEELSENTGVQKERSSTSDEPAEVDQDISAIYRRSLALVTVLSPATIVANRVECKNTEHVCEIAEACK